MSKKQNVLIVDGNLFYEKASFIYGFRNKRKYFNFNFEVAIPIVLPEIIFFY
jgi:hypothetical protein